jgi:HEPN domain-containing protein
VQHGTDPPKIHDLVVLVQYCAKFDEVFFQYQKQCAYISEYAVAFRYVDVEEVEAAEAKQAYRNAKIIYRFCKHKIKDEHNE